MHTRMRVAATAALALIGAAGGTLVATPAAQANDTDGIKNVIYLLGDGMGRTQVTATRQRYFGAEGLLNMEQLPVEGQVATYAVGVNSGQPGQPGFVPNYVTDSSSAATAWASGVKTYNNANGIDAKGHVVATLMEKAKAAGFATGNVSTAEITDATPAGQFSHTLQRACQGPDYVAASCQKTDVEVSGGATIDPVTEADPNKKILVTPIAEQIANNDVADVILGGGLQRFDAADETALKAADGGAYTVLGSPAAGTVATKSQLAALAPTTGKVFGLFSKGNMTIEKYKREHTGTPENEEPSVADMTAKAIELLKAKSDADGNSKGFYLQVEGALIDKRSHANDAAQTLEETKAFDDAVKIAKDFAEADGHTLVIVTADHECAGFNIIEKNTFVNAEAAAPPVNKDANTAPIVGNDANNSTPLRTSSGAKDNKRSWGFINGPTGQTVSPGDGAIDATKNFAPATFGTADQGADFATYSALDGTANGNLWLTYLSGNHTGADVPIFSFGAGSELLNGEIDNTDLYDIVGSALGVEPIIPLPVDPTVTATATATATATTTTTATATTTVTVAPVKQQTALSLSGPTLVKRTLYYKWVAKGSNIPAGSAIVFKDGTRVVKTVSLVSGKAVAKLRLKRGRHNLTASYVGSSTRLASSSPTLTVVSR